MVEAAAPEGEIGKDALVGLLVARGALDADELRRQARIVDAGEAVAHGMMALVAGVAGEQDLVVALSTTRPKHAVLAGLHFMELRCAGRRTSASAPLEHSQCRMPSRTGATTVGGEAAAGSLTTGMTGTPAEAGVVGSAVLTGVAAGVGSDGAALMGAALTGLVAWP